MLSKRHSFGALLLMLTAAVAVRADKVDDYVKAEMLKQHIPGQERFDPGMFRSSGPPFI